MSLIRESHIRSLSIERVSFPPPLLVGIAGLAAWAGIRALLHKLLQRFFFFHPFTGWKVWLHERPWGLVFPLWLSLRVLALQVEALSVVPFEFNSEWNKLRRQARAKLTAANKAAAQVKAAGLPGRFP